MVRERTFAIIKPDAVQGGHVGEIISVVEQEGFSIHGVRLALLTRELIKGFYLEHLHKPFYPELEEFMLEGPVLLMVLEGDDAVAHWREIMGATDPVKAEPGTLRRKFGRDMTRNAVHGSDSRSTAEQEIHYFFSALDLV